MTGETIAPITTGQIYWGAVPFVVIQIIMIGLTIAFPGMVMRYKAGEIHLDSTNIQIQSPSFGNSAPNFGGPNFGNPAPAEPPAPGTAAPAPTGPNFGGASTATPAPASPAGPNFGAPATGQ